MNTQKLIKKLCVSPLHSALKKEKAFACFVRDMRKEKVFSKNDAKEMVMFHDTESRFLNHCLDLSFPFYRA